MFRRGEIKLQRRPLDICLRLYPASRTDHPEPRHSPPQFMWNKMIDGAYNQLVLTFLGTDLNPIVIQDPSMTILLTIKDQEEVGGKS